MKMKISNFDEKFCVNKKYGICKILDTKVDDVLFLQTKTNKTFMSSENELAFDHVEDRKLANSFSERQFNILDLKSISLSLHEEFSAYENIKFNYSDNSKFDDFDELEIESKFFKLKVNQDSENYSFVLLSNLEKRDIHLSTRLIVDRFSTSKNLEDYAKIKSIIYALFDFLSCENIDEAQKLTVDKRDDFAPEKYY